jgi:hypothetical protein
VSARRPGRDAGRPRGGGRTATSETDLIWKLTTLGIVTGHQTTIGI